MTGQHQVFFDQALRGHMHRHKAYFVALAFNPEVHYAVAALNVPDPEGAELFTADAVIEQGGEDSAIAHTL